MATKQMSYLAIVACLLLYFSSQSIDAVDNFHFDDRSCDSLLPQTDAVTPGRPNDPSRESSPEDVFPKTDRKSTQNAQKTLLVASNEDSPYEIDISWPAFSEKDKLFTVTLQGGEFNGFIIQARSLRSSNAQSVRLGWFTDLPFGVEILRCSTGRSSYSANTVISTDTSLKNSVKLTWKSEPGHLKNMVFVATFVKNNTYWTNVKTNPLRIISNPDFNICGTATSCYRYSGTSKACAEDECNLFFISELGDGQVYFTVGGILTEPTGYIGVAFTNEKFGKLDLFACVLETKGQIKSKYYAAKDIESQPFEQSKDNMFLTAGGSNNPRQVDCSFMRNLQVPGSQLADFTQPQTMMFLRGPLTNWDGVDLVPQLGNSSVFAQHPWSATAMEDILVTSEETSTVQPTSKPDGVSRGEPLIFLTFVSIAVTLFHAAAN